MYSSSTPLALALQTPPSAAKEKGGVARLPPRDYVLCSLFTFEFFNCCCLGFVALVLSFKSRDCKAVGDIEGAAVYGAKAKRLNIVSIVLSVVFIIILIILLATSVIHFQVITLGFKRAALITNSQMGVGNMSEINSMHPGYFS